MADKKMSAMVVEDDAAVRETLREFLLHREFQVVVAHDGNDGISHLEQDASFEVILTDLRLPNGGGLEILKRARELNPWTYVVLITGFATLESAIEAVRLGAFDYLVKPFCVSELDLTLNRISEHRRLRRHNLQLSGRLKRSRPLKKILAQHKEIFQSLEQLAGELREQRKLIQSLVDERRQPEALALAEHHNRE